MPAAKSVKQIVYNVIQSTFWVGHMSNFTREECTGCQCSEFKILSSCAIALQAIAHEQFLTIDFFVLLHMVIWFSPQPKHPQKLHWGSSKNSFPSILRHQLLDLSLPLIHKCLKTIMFDPCFPRYCLWWTSLTEALYKSVIIITKAIRDHPNATYSKICHF